jgi:hypothetical protein
MSSAKFGRVLLAAAIAAGSMGFTASVATAKTYTKHEYQNRDVCYRVMKVPATVEYNTRGTKLRDASRSWSGNLYKHGGKVVDKYHDPVYIQTKRIIEDQHYTLVPSKC